MILSIKKLPSRIFFAPAIMAVALIVICFKTDKVDTEMAMRWSRICLVQNCNTDGDSQVKKWNIQLTDDLFIRFRKIYLNGKQEYYSFNIRDFNEVGYVGTVTIGMLQLKTDTGAVIQQTYDDPKGNEDNMINVVNIPMKNMDPGKVDSLRMMLLFLKNGR